MLPRPLSAPHSGVLFPRAPPSIKRLNCRLLTFLPQSSELLQAGDRAVRPQYQLARLDRARSLLILLPSTYMATASMTWDWNYPTLVTIHSSPPQHPYSRPGCVLLHYKTITPPPRRAILVAEESSDIPFLYARDVASRLLSRLLSFFLFSISDTPSSPSFSNTIPTSDQQHSISHNSTS